jgi:hypothetical protein
MAHIGHKVPTVEFLTGAVRHHSPVGKEEAAASLASGSMPGNRVKRLLTTFR